jgi:hypothetical protein
MPNVQPIMDNVRELSPLHMATSAVDQMDQLRASVKGFCPADADVTLTFDGRCRIHIDVRTVEEVMAVESAIQKFASGVFDNVHRATVPGRAFLRRVSATVG